MSVIPNYIRQPVAAGMMAATLAAPSFMTNTAKAEDKANVDVPVATRPAGAAELHGRVLLAANIPGNNSVTKLETEAASTLTYEQIAKEDLSSNDKIVEFAIKNGFVDSDSQILRANLEGIQDRVRVSSKEVFTPEIFVKRLALLVKDGYLDRKEAGLLMTDNQHSPEVTHYAVGYLRDLARDLERFEKTNQREENRPVDVKNHNTPITRNYIRHNRLASFFAERNIVLR